MSNDLIAQVHQETATRNAQTAVKAVKDLSSELKERVDRLEGLVANMHNKQCDLERKYNLLLSKSFSGGSTSGN